MLYILMIAVVKQKSLLTILIFDIAFISNCATILGAGDVAQYEARLAKPRNSTRIPSLDQDSIVETHNTQEQEEFIGVITITSGCGIVRGAFMVSDWPASQVIDVYLRTRDDKELFSNSWISFDKERNIVAFPLPGNYGEFIFLFCAKNRAGQIRKNKFKIEVATENIKSMHNIVLTLKTGFQQFISNPLHRMHFVSTFVKYLQQRGIPTSTQDMLLTSTDSTNNSILWVLSMYKTDSCNEIMKKRLPAILMTKDRPHSELIKALEPYASLSHAALVIHENCPKPTVRQKVSKSNNNVIVGPILLILIMMGVCSPTFVAYFIRRSMKKREFRRARSIRHFYANGNATPIWLENDDEAVDETSDEEKTSHRLQYRWTPDLKNRQPVVLPKGPPPSRAALDVINCDSNSDYNIRKSAWHGLPTEQCAEANGMQIVDIVQSISRSASTLKNIFVNGSDKGSVEKSERSKDEDSSSVKSDGAKILESAFKKVSSYIGINNLLALRVSQLDVNENNETRRSSGDTRNSSFEYSTVSSDHLTHSQFSSRVNSFDIEYVGPSRSCFQDNLVDDHRIPNEYIFFDQDQVESGPMFEAMQNEEHIMDNQVQETLQRNDFIINPIGFRDVEERQESEDRKRYEDSEGILMNINRDKAQPLRRHSSRRPLIRMPPLQLADSEAENENMLSDLHPWQQGENDLHIEEGYIGMRQDYHLPRRFGYGESQWPQRDVNADYCNGEDVPTLV